MARLITPPRHRKETDPHSTLYIAYTTLQKLEKYSTTPCTAHKLNSLLYYIQA